MLQYFIVLIPLVRLSQVLIVMLTVIVELSCYQISFFLKIPPIPMGGFLFWGMADTIGE